MGKNKKFKKPKPKCCGKFKKKNKHCSRCPVLLKKQCRIDTDSSKMGKKKEDKKKAKKKSEKTMSKKKVDKKKDKKKKEKKLK